MEILPVFPLFFFDRFLLPDLFTARYLRGVERQILEFFSDCLFVNSTYYKIWNNSISTDCHRADCLRPTFVSLSPPALTGDNHHTRCTLTPSLSPRLQYSYCISSLFLLKQICYSFLPPRIFLNIRLSHTADWFSSAFVSTLTSLSLIIC